MPVQACTSSCRYALPGGSWNSAETTFTVTWVCPWSGVTVTVSLSTLPPESSTVSVERVPPLADRVTAMPSGAPSFTLTTTPVSLCSSSAVRVNGAPWFSGRVTFPRLSRPSNTSGGSAVTSSSSISRIRRLVRLSNRSSRRAVSSLKVNSSLFGPVSPEKIVSGSVVVCVLDRTSSVRRSPRTAGTSTPFRTAQASRLSRTGHRR